MTYLLTSEAVPGRKPADASEKATTHPDAAHAVGAVPMSGIPAEDVDPGEGQESATNGMLVAKKKKLRQELIEKEEVELYGVWYTVEPDTATEDWSKKNVGNCGEGLIVAVRNKQDKRFALKIVLSSRTQDVMRSEVELLTFLGDNQHVARSVRPGRFEGLPYVPAVESCNTIPIVVTS